jgi:putative FmdB family regulatory protein
LQREVLAAYWRSADTLADQTPSHPQAMPTYDYECQTCGHQFEAKQSMKDPHLTDCPQEVCAGPVKRKIGAGAGFIFKGTGFYITDYRSDSYKAAAKKDSDSSSSSSSSTSSASSTPTPAPAKSATAA